MPLTRFSVRLPALAGVFFLLLALLRTACLAQGTWFARAVLTLCFLLLALLSLLLLRREGVSRRHLLALLLPIGAAFFLRALLLDHVTLDYQDFLSQWVEHFRQQGGFAALKDPVGNYNVPYLYLLALLSYLPIPDLYGIKFFSILFDVLLAWGGLRLAKTLTRDELPPIFAFAALLLLPTVVLNGACWGQCDSVWAALCVHALASALNGRPKTSLVLLALAFSFKLQAIFLLPLWCAFWLTGHVKLRHLPVFPAVFVLTMVPALLTGKPVMDILNVYWDQAGSSVAWETLNYNSPSIFALLPYGARLPAWAPRAAIALAFLFVLGLLTLLIVRRSRADHAALVLAGAALALGVPFLLPYMHERYFFLGGVLLVVWACIRPSHIPAAAAAELASLGGYHAYLMKYYVMTLHLFGLTWAQPAEGLLMLFALSAALFTLWRTLFRE